MDKDTLDQFAAYCRQHKITFSLHQYPDGTFRLNFSAENDKDIAELLQYLKRRQDDKTTK